MSGLHGLAAAALRLLDPEYAHHLTIGALKAGLGPRSREPEDPILATHLAGLQLANPIGLAAGFDKNAEVPHAMLKAGFGFVECGAATPRPQPGNPRPRLFRLTQDRAVINRMGFNNDGLDAFATRLGARPRTGVIGANIGANKDSGDRIGDYVIGMTRLWGLCDYFSINVSSPNTPGLRALQGKGALADLLGAISAARARLAGGGDVPVFLKVTPDLADGEAVDIVEAGIAFGLDGIIVANTTMARPKELRGARRCEVGGLSGAPLMVPSTRLLRTFHEAARGRLALVGVGGIASGADAYAKIRAGACAVQLYTALVFEGPGLIVRIRRELAGLLRADGFGALAEAVGAR